MKALILLGEGFEDLEFFYPYFRLLEAEFEVDVASGSVGGVKGKHGYSFEVSKTYDDVAAADYDLLVLPGGQGPEKVRLNTKALGIVRQIWEHELTVASICHGIQILISANLVKGMHATCWPGVKDDLIAAGGIYEDRPVVIDGQLVTSRDPFDLPAFCDGIFQVIKLVSVVREARKSFRA